MNQKQLRDVNFFIHRYLGLLVALILIVVGLTGSILVFQKEIDHFLVNGATTTYISIPTKPEGVFRFNKKFPQDNVDFGRSQVYIDPGQTHLNSRRLV